VTLALWTGIVVSLASRAACQLPDPKPTGSHWLVAGPEEVVGWFTFDPAGVTSRLPEYLRFVTVGELASSGIRWAVDYLAHHKAHADWGVSFLEIVRADTFAIDGRQPNWPQRGAAAVWFARVLPKPGTPDLGPGLPLLMLEFWIPDSAYVTFMQQRGHYSTCADVRLARHGDRWEGSINGPDFAIRVGCTPGTTVSGGPNSSGSQVLIPPRGSGLTTVIPISFAGHRERICAEPFSWAIDGRHPLRAAVAVESASFQYGYRLTGAPISRAPQP
jgi:hypothetical protein